MFHLRFLCAAVLGLCCACGFAEAQQPAPALEADLRFPSEEALHTFIDQAGGGGAIIGSVRGAEAHAWLSASGKRAAEKLGAQVTLAAPAPREKQSAYHDYAGVTAALAACETAYPDICRRFTLGPSVEGRQLWALFISNNPAAEEDEPEFKYVSTMHGNENLGTEMCLDLIALLLEGYGTDERITSLVDATAIWIVPLMNPDGLARKQRYNAHNLDLNRSFPIFGTDFTGTWFDGEPLGASSREPEVRHVMEWTAANSFVLSANFHTGALLVNYPYDDDGKPSGADAPTPDDLLFEEISTRYAEWNQPMYTNPDFPGGIVNGTKWYVAVGGMQDWHYRYMGCMEVTIELFDRLVNNPQGSSFYLPPAADLPQYWEENREAMLAYMESVHLGVRGVVTDRRTGAPLTASVTVEGNAQRVYTDPDVGDYHRLLLPGSYALTFEAPGYIPYRASGIAVADGPAVRGDITLSNGDINLDGAIDAADVQLAVNAVLGIETGFDADVNGGGASATDIQAVILRALKR